MDRLQDREERVETTCFMGTHGELRQEQLEKLCFTSAAGITIMQAIMQACLRETELAQSMPPGALMDFTAARCFMWGFMRPLWQQWHKKHSCPSSLALHGSSLAPLSLDKPGGGPMRARSSKSSVILSPARSPQPKPAKL